MDRSITHDLVDAANAGDRRADLLVTARRPNRVGCTNSTWLTRRADTHATSLRDDRVE
jgi:hypothetical protein